MLYGVFLQSSSPDLIVAVFLLAAAIIVAAVIIGVRIGKAKPAPATVPATVDMDSLNRMIESLEIMRSTGQNNPLILTKNAAKH